MYADDINLFHSYDSVTVIQRPQKKKKTQKTSFKILLPCTPLTYSL